jgi:hypothetical protein
MSVVLVLKKVLVNTKRSRGHALDNHVARDVLNELSIDDMKSLADAHERDELTTGFKAAMAENAALSGNPIGDVPARLSPATLVALRQDYAVCPPDGSGP